MTDIVKAFLPHRFSERILELHAQISGPFGVASPSQKHVSQARLKVINFVA